MSKLGELPSLLNQLHDSRECRFSLYENLIKHCRDNKDLSTGRIIHSHIQQTKRRSDRYLCNLLVEMYGKCGEVWEARKIFDTIRDPNIFSWSLMFVAYAHNGHLQEARDIFDRMPEKDITAWNAMVKLYIDDGNLNSAKCIFDQMPGFDVYSWTIMITAYARDGNLSEAEKVFNEMPYRSNVTWNAMLSVYIRDGRISKAESLFREMPFPDSVSWNSIISANAKNGCLQRAVELFEKSPEKNIVTWNAMITGFLQADNLDKAKEIFGKMSERDMVSWNAMIAGYAQRGLLIHAKELFEEMPEKDPVSWNSLIAGYALNGHIEDARAMFDTMSCQRDIVSWNAMIAGYAQNGYGREAIHVFNKMLVDSYVPPNFVTCISVLDACASNLDVTKGREVHGRVLAHGFQLEAEVGNALMNMYGKCGYLNRAQKLLETMPGSTVVSWNTLVCLYAQGGHPLKVFELLWEMSLNGNVPNAVTFSGVLSGCSHAGFWVKVRGVVKAMVEDFDVEPIAEHYACVIDLLGRSGQLKEAEHLLSYKPDLVACMALAGASKLHGDSNAGVRAAYRASEYDPESAAPYVFLVTR